jgi:hypothetical protein
MPKKPMDNLWIKLVKVSAELVQHVNNWRVTHSPKNRHMGYAPTLPVLCTVLVHRYFGQYNRLHYRLIPIVHTPNNYYYINK